MSYLITEDIRSQCHSVLVYDFLVHVGIIGINN